MQTIERIYAEEIQPLPAAEQLRLAQMILEGIPPESTIDDSDDWSEEDRRDATRYALKRADDAAGHYDNV